MDTHVFKTIDGHEIKADVYRAAGDEVRPAILYIHGGALILGSRERIRPWQLKIRTPVKLSLNPTRPKPESLSCPVVFSTG